MTTVTDIQKLLEEWEKAKAETAAALVVIATEQALRKKVIAAAFPSPEEGVNKFSLENGWVLKATCPVTRTVDEAVAVGERIAASPVLRLGGVTGYEGAFAHDTSAEALTSRVRTRIIGTVTFKYFFIINLL